jgi:aspartate-semialdehyde dehydrogenase
VLALKPLHDEFKIKRVVTSTYQSVSGGGKNHMVELEEQTKSVLENKEVKSKNFTKQIAFNVIPHIDSFMEDGSTKEEWKMVVETQKILDPSINLTATCVRVPVFVGHSESVNIEFNNNINLEKIKSCLSSAPGCKVVDEHKDGGYITPAEIDGDFTTYISRIREDKTKKNSINMWVVSDNLLKGAALNAIQIAQLLCEKYLK